MIRLLGRVIRMISYAALLMAVLFLFALRFAPAWMAHEDVAGVADYIVPLGGSAIRAEYSAELFRRGFADRVLVGRLAVTPEDVLLERYGVMVTRKELAYHYIMTAEGVPAGAVRFFGRQITSTEEEAEALAGIIGAGPGRIVVVTSPYHAFRARMILQNALPEWTVMIVCPPDDQLAAAWWANKSDFYTVLSEFVETIRYMSGAVVAAIRGVVS